MSAENPVSFETKVKAFLKAHQKIVDEFENSLSNANQFLELATISVEKEPLETLSMLEQIREIDLLGHLTRQYEEYQNVAGFFTSAEPQVEIEDLKAQLGAVLSRYQSLMHQAEGQMERIEELLGTLRQHH